MEITWGPIRKEGGWKAHTACNKGKVEWEERTRKAKERE